MKTIDGLAKWIEANRNKVMVLDDTSTDMVLKALTEYKQYKEIGTVEECREAREGQKPKKPNRYSGVSMCPECGRKSLRCYYYCPGCGQVIDWGEP